MNAVCACLPGLPCTCPTEPPATVGRSRIEDVADLDPMPYPWARYGVPEPGFYGTVQEWDELLAAARWLAAWNGDCMAAADANPSRRGTTRARKGTLRKATW